jgi:hypothetical protein
VPFHFSPVVKEVSTPKDETLRKIVNASGFLFQLRVEREVKKEPKHHQWTILAREHPWADEGTGKSGYIDLVLADTGYARLVIECKRTQEANWIFLVPDKAHGTHARSMWVNSANEQQFRSGWFDCYPNPESFISEFCVVRGQGESDPPMLERIASNLIDSTESLAVEEVMVSSRHMAIDKFLYFPLIVTNANLYVCRFDSSDISLDEGKIATGQFESVQFIRFRKCLTVRLNQTVAPNSIRDTNRDKIRTVFIIQANYLRSFLNEFSVKLDRFSMPPW